MMYWPFKPFAYLPTACAVFCAAVVLGGCTQEMKDYYAYELKPEVKNYDYHQIWDFMFGYELPNRRQAEGNQLKQLCMHKDSEERTVSVNGQSDAYTYRRCTLALYPPVPGDEPTPIMPQPLANDFKHNFQNRQPAPYKPRQKVEFIRP